MAPKGGDKGTPKDLSKRMKSKGMKKLKWFCQMCNKQCGDQNGFKRHCESESHQRQLLLFAENQDSYLKEFSKDFEANFMHIFKHTFGGKRTRANAVYQEYIRDRGHVHMNATVWHTLGGFVRYLGESGKCKIDENEKGWHIQYIDKEEEMRKKKIIDRAKQERTDDDRMADMLQRQIEKDMAKIGDNAPAENEPKEFVRENEGQKIQFKLAPTKLSKNTMDSDEPKQGSSSQQESNNEDVKPSKHELDRQMNANSSKRDNDRQIDEKPSKYDLDRQRDVKPSRSDLDRYRDVKPSIKKDSGRKRTALDELMEQEERFKERKNRKDYWLQRGIIVKVVSKKASDKFYKQKGEVINVVDKHTAEIKLPSGEVEKFSDNYLETVIPSIGREMLIVNGAYRGEIAELEEILEDKYLLKLRICEGVRNGRVIEVSYEDASKLA